MRRSCSSSSGMRFASRAPLFVALFDSRVERTLGMQPKLGMFTGSQPSSSPSARGRGRSGSGDPVRARGDALVPGDEEHVLHAPGRRRAVELPPSVAIATAKRALRTLSLRVDGLCDTLL